MFGAVTIARQRRRGEPPSKRLAAFVFLTVFLGVAAGVAARLS